MPKIENLVPFTSDNQPANRGRKVGSLNRKTIVEKWLSVEKPASNPLTQEIEHLSTADRIALEQIAKAINEGDTQAAEWAFSNAFGKQTDKLEVSQEIDATLLKLINTLIDWITETFPKPPEEHQAFQNEVVERFGAWDSASLKQLFTDAAELADNYKEAINK